MSIISSLYTGVSGLTAHGDAISVVGDNITNSNTVGYKSSRANFEDVLARSVGSTTTGIGLGTRIGSVQRLLAQGALLGTGLSTDLAIKGDGYFIVKGSSDGLNGNFYTRAGQFHIDNDGFLVNEQNLRLQGYGINGAGDLQSAITDLTIPTYQVAPLPTTTVDVVANLDSASTQPAGAFSVADPTGTSNFSTTVTVYDSLGQSHTTNIYFRKEAAAGAWTWHALVDGAEITGGTAGTPEEEASGTMTFDTQGRLTAQATTASDFDFLSATQNQAIAFNFGDDIGAGGTGLRGITNYASPSSTSFIDQDGYSSGSLAGIAIASDGTVSGLFSNGLQRTVGQVVLADFQNAQDMQRIGGNLLIETVESGQPVIGAASDSGRGSINAGALEQSNVDIGHEFVDMIAFQRGFQASSRTITTADDMLQEVLSLKR